MPENWDVTAADPDVQVFNINTGTFEVAQIDTSFPGLTGLSSGGRLVWHTAQELHARSGQPVEMIGGLNNSEWVGAGRESRYYHELLTTIAAAGVDHVDPVISGQREGNRDSARPERAQINSETEYRAALDTLLTQLEGESLYSAQTDFSATEHVPNPVSDDRNDVLLTLNSDERENTHSAYATGLLVETPGVESPPESIGAYQACKPWARALSKPGNAPTRPA